MALSSSDVSSLAPLEHLTEQQRQVLLNVIYRIHRSLELPEVLNTTSAEIRRTLSADRVGIFRFDADSNHQTGEFIAESVVTPYPSAIATPVSDKCFGDNYAASYSKGGIQAVSNIYDANLSQCHIDILAQFEIQANLIVPLQVNEKLWGLVCVHQCSEPRTWLASEIEFIRHIAYHLDIAIQQGQQLQRTVEQSKRLEKLTLERDRFFRLSPNLFCVLDFAGNLMRVNPAWQNILGYSSEALLQANIWSLIHPADQAVSKSALQAVIDKNAPLHLEHRFCCVDGSYKHLSWSGNCIPGEKKIYAIARDITKQKKLEFSLARRTKTLEKTLARLKKTQSHLVQSAKMSSLGQLVAGVAHEINNPINFISGNISHVYNYTSSLTAILQGYQKSLPKPDPHLQELCEEAELDYYLLEDLPQVIKSIKCGSERIQRLVSSLKSFSRLDQSTAKTVDIHEGLDSTLSILQSRLQETSKIGRIRVQCRYADLPHIDCYPGQLNQVFLHVLNNAIDAIAQSKKASNGLIIIATELNEDDKVIAIKIRDNGIGMDQEISQKIFDPFFSTKDVGQGTGLGLSISYQVITQHHKGKITCKSQLGVGSEFIIVLPIKRPYNLKAITP